MGVCVCVCGDDGVRGIGKLTRRVAVQFDYQCGCLCICRQSTWMVVLLSSDLSQYLVATDLHGMS